MNERARAPSVEGPHGAGFRIPCALCRRSFGARGERWLIETTLLVLVGVILTIATVNDVARQRNVNERLIADLRTWRTYTGHDYHNLSDRSGTARGEQRRREVVCGNARAGCAEDDHSAVPCDLTGPVVNGRRTVHGGWYLRAHRARN